MEGWIAPVELIGTLGGACVLALLYRHATSFILKPKEFSVERMVYLTD